MEPNENHTYAGAMIRHKTDMANKRVLILGGTGMLGHVLLRYFSDQPGFEVYATSRDFTGITKLFPAGLAARFVKENINGSNLDAIIGLLRRIKPSIVLNCIGIIKQLPAAHDPLAAIAVNSLFPHQLAEICRDHNIRMVHISTDCVFGGKKGMYTENDTPDPEDLYGRSKLLGEVDYAGCITLRTSIIGHELQSRNGLVEWFLGESGTVRGYTNAIYTGFPTIEMARIITGYVIPNPQLSGVYHVSSDPISKYDLLKLVSRKYGKVINIEPYEEFVLDRSLVSSRFRKMTRYEPPPWTDMIDTMYKDYEANREQYYSIKGIS